MRDGEPGDIRQLRDAQTLSALANPDRARLMDSLAVHGPSSTSELARSVHLATGSVSHHLKVLVAAGLVAPDSEAVSDRRVRRWRLVSRGLRFSPAHLRDSPSAEASARAADTVLFERQVEHARQFMADADAPWEDVALATHTWLRMTPGELADFGRQLEDLILAWRRREVPDDDQERRPVLAFARAFPADP